MSKVPVPQNEFVRQMVVTTYSCDSPATEAWLSQWVKQYDTLEANAFSRAAFHWEACTESEKEAIAGFYGWEYGHQERFPFPAKIKSDYDVAIALTARLLG